MWGKHTVHSSDKEQKPWTTEHWDKDGHRSGDKNRDREHEKSKKSDNWHGSDRPHGCSPRCKDHDGAYEHHANGKCKRSHGHDSPSDSCKTKQRWEMSASPSHDCRKSHTPERRPLPPPPMFHAMPRRLSSDPTSAHLSFDQSWGSLPPVDLGGGEPCPISSVSAPIQVGILSVSGPISLPSESVSALRLTADHTKEIFNLACEWRQLKERVVREFVKLSSQEVLFCTQAQSTGYKMLASGHPDRFTAYYVILRSDEESTEAKDKAMEELLNRVSEAWLRTNASSFKCAGLWGEVGRIFRQSWGLDKSAGGAHLDDDASNNQGHQSAIMRWPRYCILSPGHTPLLSSKPRIPEHFTHDHWVRARSLCSVALAGAP